MEPVSTEQLRNSLSIASTFESGVNATAHWNDKPVECLENATVYTVATYVSRSWPSSFWGLGDDVRADRQLLAVCNIMFLCQHLGVAPEAGAYSQDKMSDPAYKPPLRFRLALKLQNGGRIYAGRYVISFLEFPPSLLACSTMYINPNFKLNSWLYISCTTLNLSIINCLKWKCNLL